MTQENEIQRATETLIQFLRDSDQRVLALKGAWGIGKSFFVRKFIEENRAKLPPYFAFVSVFGLGSLSEVRDVVSGCIESTDGNLLSKAGRVASKVASKFYRDIPDLSNAAFWYLAKRNGLFLILDDIERAQDGLGLEQLLGFASSLTENSKAKVLLIFNEDSLEKQKADVLVRYREKVIDTELEYRPSTTELVAQFLPVPVAHEAVAQCLKASGGANIRLILRIKRALRDFKQALASYDLRASDGDLIQVARIVWFFHVSPKPVTPEILQSCYVRGLLGRSDSEANTEEDKKIAELATAGQLQPSNLDPLMLAYLRSGYFPGESLNAYVQEERDNEQKAEYQQRSREAYSPYVSNFRASPEDVVRPIERLLDDYADKIDFETLKRHCDFVSRFGRPTSKWWVQHLRTSVPKYDLRNCQEALTIVTDPEAIKILEARRDELKVAFDPKATLSRVAGRDGYNLDEIVSLNLFSEDYYREWFRTEDEPKFLGVLRSFLGICSAVPAENARTELREKLFRVLQDIAAESPANEWRVYEFLSVPRK